MIQLLQFLIFAAPAALLLVLAARDIRKAMRMRRWPRVEGTIRDVRTRGGTRDTVKVDVNMAYDYDGRSFVTWCASPTKAGYSTQGIADTDALRNLLETFQPGQTRSVIVNPEKPAEAFIRTPELTVIFGMLAGALALLAVGILSAVAPLE